MEDCSWRTNSPLVKIPVQIMKLRPSTLLQTEMNITIPGLQMEKLNGSKLSLSHMENWSQSCKWTQASWIPPLVLFYLPTSYFMTENVLSGTAGGSFVCKPGWSLWLSRLFSGGTLVLASLLLPWATRASWGCLPPAAIGTVLLVICMFPDLVGVCLFKN